MRKRLATLGLLLTVTSFYSAAGQTATPPNKSGGSANSNSQGKNGAPVSPPAVANIPQQPTDLRHQGEAGGKEAEHSVTLTNVPPLTINEKQKTFLDYVYQWGPWFFGLFLAIAGGVQLRLMRVTWVAIKEQKTQMEQQVAQMKTQAGHMERQLRLQEAQFKQWTEIGSWKNVTPHPRPSAAEPTVTLSFEVGNATQFPFTLRKVATKKGNESFALSNMQHLIPPQDSYLANVSFDLSETELELYQLNNLTAMVEIETEIRDVLQKECEPQHFRQNVTFGQTRCEASEHRPHLQMRIKRIK